MYRVLYVQMMLPTVHLPSSKSNHIHALPNPFLLKLDTSKPAPVFATISAMLVSLLYWNIAHSSSTWHSMRKNLLNSMLLNVTDLHLTYSRPIRVYRLSILTNIYIISRNITTCHLSFRLLFMTESLLKNFHGLKIPSDSSKPKFFLRTIAKNLFVFLLPHSFYLLNKDQRAIIRNYRSIFLFN